MRVSILPALVQIPSQQPGFDFTDEMRNAVNVIQRARGPVFVGGNAGTGKSTLLRFIRDEANPTVAVLAPTGAAALNVSGATIHSFFRFPTGLMTNHQFRTSNSFRNVCSRLSGIIIDEVSMVRADLLDGIDVSLKMHRNSSAPFGGLPVVFFGDVAQLPPVIGDDVLKLYFSDLYDSPYFFDAAVFRSAKMEQVWLTTVFRQLDAGFVELLNRIRNATADEGELSILNAQVNPRAELEERDAIVLTTTRRAADDTNTQRLSELPDSNAVFHATINGRVDEKAYPANRTLTLKIGARVVLLHNNGHLWKNGTLGIVRAFGNRDGEDCIQVDLPSGLHWIRRHTWDVIRYVPKQTSPGLDQEVIGSFQQFPLRLAWAITIHKSQGMSFERVILNLAGGAFEYGQLYVALSRCRSLSGLRLVAPIRLSDLRYHPLSLIHI